MSKTQTKSSDQAANFEFRIPASTAVGANFPSGLRPAGTSGLVTLKIYYILGNEVETLVNEEKPADSYEVTWNAEGIYGS